jgi:hypothetical protein
LALWFAFHRIRRAKPLFIAAPVDGRLCGI